MVTNTPTTRFGQIVDLTCPSLEVMQEATKLKTPLINVLYPFKKIMMWASPRTMSTLAWRYFLERDDTVAVNSCFREYGYFSRDRIKEAWDRFPDVEPKDSYELPGCFREISKPIDRPILFAKSQAYHLHDQVGHPFFEDWTNIFITRHPYETFVSQHKIWPDFEPIDTGYDHQVLWFKHITEKWGHEPIVIDGTSLRIDPSIMEVLCDRVDIEFLEDAMTWEKRRVTGDRTGNMDDDFYDGINKSTGFNVMGKKDFNRIISYFGSMPNDYKGLAEMYIPHYEYLAQHAIRPTAKKARGIWNNWRKCRSKL